MQANGLAVGRAAGGIALLQGTVVTGEVIRLHVQGGRGEAKFHNHALPTAKHRLPLLAARRARTIICIWNMPGMRVDCWLSCSVGFLMLKSSLKTSTAAHSMHTLQSPGFGLAAQRRVLAELKRLPQ